MECERLKKFFFKWLNRKRLINLIVVEGRDCCINEVMMRIMIYDRAVVSVVEVEEEEEVVSVERMS